jgi:hypothetical protein
MNYKEIKELINDLEQQDKLLESKTLQDWERKEVVQDWYETKKQLHNELGFAKIDSTNGNSVYWHISPDEIDAEPEGLSYIMERTETEMQKSVEKSVEFAMNLAYVHGSSKGIFNRVCIDIDDEQKFICEQCEHEFRKDELHELGNSKFCGNCYQQLTGGKG